MPNISLPLGEGGSRRLTDEGNATQKSSSQLGGKMKNSYLMENCFRNNMLNADTAPLIRLLRRHLTTVAAKRFPGTIRARQSCRICSPSGRAGSRSLIAPASRGPSSKSVRFFCRRRRFASFPQGKALGHRLPDRAARLKRGNSLYRTRPRSVGGNRTNHRQGGLSFHVRTRAFLEP